METETDASANAIDALMNARGIDTLNHCQGHVVCQRFWSWNDLLFASKPFWRDLSYPVQRSTSGIPDDKTASIQPGSLRLMQTIGEFARPMSSSGPSG